MLNFFRFVRFVSTPEILERVYTQESEILQIVEAIVIQSNNDGGLHSVSYLDQCLSSLIQQNKFMWLFSMHQVEDHGVKPAESVEGTVSVYVRVITLCLCKTFFFLFACFFMGGKVGSLFDI